MPQGRAVLHILSRRKYISIFMPMINILAYFGIDSTCISKVKKSNLKLKKY